MCYSKIGLARFIGTLELSALFHRSARRAGLPIAFSQGHHPLPRFAFGPALPLGTESEAEYVDVDLTEIQYPDAVAAALNLDFPRGLEVTTAETVGRRFPSIGSSIVGFRYRIDAADLIELRGLQSLQTCLKTFAEAESFPLCKRVKGAERTIDARQFVDGVELEPGAITATILFGPTGTLKPAELMATILDLPPDLTAGLRIRKVATLFRSWRSDTASPIHV
jgi:radical SAM-linked protein